MDRGMKGLEKKGVWNASSPGLTLFELLDFSRWWSFTFWFSFWSTFDPNLMAMISLLFLELQPTTSKSSVNLFQWILHSPKSLWILSLLCLKCMELHKQWSYPLIACLKTSTYPFLGLLLNSSKSSCLPLLLSFWYLHLCWFGQVYQC